MATQQQLLDLVLAEHPPGAIPGFGETAARFFLNHAVAVFCEETRLWRGKLTITTTEGATAYALNADRRDATASSLYRVTVPALGSGRVLPRLLTPIHEVLGPTSTGGLPVFYVEPDETGAHWLHVGSLGSRQLVALDAGLAVEVMVAGKPAPLTDTTVLYDADGNVVEDEDGNAVEVLNPEMSDALALPEEFHFGPVHYASAQLYMRRADLPMPERLAMKNHHMQEYKRLMRPARAYGERGLTPGIHPRPVYF